VIRLTNPIEKALRDAFDDAHDRRNDPRRSGIAHALEALRKVKDVLRYAGWLHPSDCPPGRYVTAMGGELWRLDEEGVEGWQRWDDDEGDGGEWVDDTPTVKLHRIPEERGL
jgi:hypothetical protein